MSRILGRTRQPDPAGPHAPPDPATDERVRALEARVAGLEDAVEDGRRLNERLSDVLDVVVELLVPAVDRDDERLRAALERLGQVV